MKTKLCPLFGVLCLAIISYDFRLNMSLWYAIMDGTSGRDREKYMALREVFLERYGDENIYQITNFYGIMGVSIFLGFISLLFFCLTLMSIEKTAVKPKFYIIQKTILMILLASASIITFLNLWSLM